MNTQPYRERFFFWLNLEKSEEFEIADQITDLKQRRQFTKTIRDGIRLICDLRAGRLNVLFELFPWVRAEFVTDIFDERIRTLERLIE